MKAENKSLKYFLDETSLNDYLKHFATLIEQNILKDSNYCFDSLAIRQPSKDLKHLLQGNGLPKLQG